MFYQRVVLVIINIFDSGDSRGKEKAKTNNTWIMGDIGYALIAARPAFCGICQTVLFGVNGSLFMSIADNRYMITSWQKSIISLTDNAMIPYQEASYMETFAGTTTAGDLDDFFEVFVPGGSLFHYYIE